jgi:hypothetical protein
MLAAESDAERCYEILQTEIREALTGLADSIDEETRLSGTSKTKSIGNATGA